MYKLIFVILLAFAIPASAESYRPCMIKFSDTIYVDANKIESIRVSGDEVRLVFGYNDSIHLRVKDPNSYMKQAIDLIQRVCR